MALLHLLAGMYMFAIPVQSFVKDLKASSPYARLISSGKPTMSLVLSERGGNTLPDAVANDTEGIGTPPPPPPEALGPPPPGVGAVLAPTAKV
eukprot:CAMPEP_0180560602 /NCGR_PEP_ID=MMETSP1037_2-20121125/2924_1 /TAXON_ID=632150 /ORGANISM="Azadinium spinosum, Strain 3D9" /LENGTH=92 /DNA_ID=CAMNT_0022577165 /DNA_START=332 /DNA_END=610 /DNA_ORIENTATION=-